MFVLMLNDAPGKTDERRGFLHAVTAGLGALLGAIVTLPGVAFLVHPLRKDTVDGGKDPLDVGASEKQVKPGEPVMVDVRGELKDAWMRTPDVKLGACWLVREKENDPVKAFSTVCPHLGCGIDWAAKKNQFLCACHNTYFDLQGKVLEGPSPRGMDELDVKLSPEGRLKVAYRRFRIGSAKKEVV